MHLSLIHISYFFFIVGSFTVGIDAVGKDFGFVVAFAEEGEVDGAATLLSRIHI